jgi:protein ImuB
MAVPERGRRIIASADDTAREAGINIGMSVTKARSLCPELSVEEADLEADAQGLHRLALWAGRRYSPFVAPDLPDGIWIDISGASHRFGSEKAMLKDMFRRVSAAGYTVQLAVADSAGCAHAAARHVPAGRPVIIEPGKTRDAMLLLPVSALRLDGNIAAELTRMGFTRVEQLIATPRAPLAKRFGRHLFQRLDQALGFAPEPIDPVFPVEMIYAYRRLLEPIGTSDAFAHVIGDLTKEIALKLEHQGQGARRLELYFERVDGQRFQVAAGTAAPNRNAAHLAKLLNARIDKIDAGLGIEVMTLVIPHSDNLRPAPIGEISSGAKRGPDLAALVDALANRFGAHSLYRATPRPCTMPEREIGTVSALASASGTGWDDDLPRPARMLNPPEMIDVTAMLPDHPPALFIWRGRRYRVTRGDGPERLHGEWWRNSGHEAEIPHSVRDYFQVETTEGGRYWLFRLGDGERSLSGPMRWYIHGAFA